MYKPERERVSFTKNGSVYYFLKAIQGWALPKKQASLIDSHTPTFPYLAMRHFPQLR